MNGERMASGMNAWKPGDGGGGTDGRGAPTGHQGTTAYGAPGSGMMYAQQHQQQPPQQYGGIYPGMAPPQGGESMGRYVQAPTARMGQPSATPTPQMSAPAVPVVGGGRRQYPQPAMPMMPVGGGAAGAGLVPPSFSGMAPPYEQQAQHAAQRPAAPAAPAARIDPAQIPRPIHASHEEKVHYNTRSETDQATHPPAATAEYVGIDLGSANPRYMRSTMSSVPNCGDLLTTCGMPLSIMVRPLALAHPEEALIPVVDNGTTGPVRCGRCKAYMNPFMRFLDHLRFQCNFCSFVTEVPPEYMCNIGHDGRRTDWTERPELCRGSVEYSAPAEYMVRPPMSPSYLFLIDVTAQSLQSGLTTSACEVISRTLDSIPGQECTTVGIATFDSAIHFYHLKEGAEKPAMLIVPDVDDSYTPLQSGLVVSLARNREAIQQLLKAIPETFASATPGPNASTAAIKAGIECLKPTGGKIMVFMSGIPNVGLGKLEARTGTSGQRTGNIEKEPLKCMAPAERNYNVMAIHAAEFQISIDLFLCASSAVDVATLGVFPRTTGGSLYRYPGFNVQQDFAQLHNDLRWNFVRPQGLEAVLRVRASAGLGLQEYNGFFCKRTQTDVDLAALDSDKTIAVTLRYEDKLPDGKEAYVQCALLYTTMTQERRIRVHTIALPVTSVLGALFRGADLDTQTCWAVRKAANTLLGGNGTLTAAKDASLQQCISTLYAYRRFCASNNSSGQLILPEGLKVLPLYTLGMHKSAGIRSDAMPDDRATWLYRALCAAPEQTTPSIYPRFFSIHDLPRDTKFPPFPAPLWLSSEKLNQEGAYLLEDGHEILIWLGRQLPVGLLRDLFGTENVDDIVSTRATIPNLSNPSSKALNDFIHAIRKQRGAFMRTRILKRGDPLEALFYNRLMEDRSPAGMSYVEYLCHVHRLIQNKSN